MLETITCSSGIGVDDLICRDLFKCELPKQKNHSLLICIEISGIIETLIDECWHMEIISHLMSILILICSYYQLTRYAKSQNH